MTIPGLSARVTDKLDSVEWDFPDSNSRGSVHTIHPYPAKFIPEIPRELIRLFHPQDGSAILDPFCGSGTTLVEAVVADYAAVGIDLHPLATLISKVKTTPIASDLTTIGTEVLKRAERRLLKGRVHIPSIPNLDHWFEKSVQNALAALIEAIATVEEDAARDALRVAFSSIVVRVSNQESDTRYAAVSKAVDEQVVWQNFARATKSVADALSNVHSSLFPFTRTCHVINKDILTVEPQDISLPIGLVITSPPYPNAYEYWLYHKYRMYWLGMDPIAVRTAEIGARPHYFKKNHQTEHDFEEQMRRCFLLLSKVMVPGGHACFIVGRSIIHGRRIDNAALLQRAASPFGFRTVGYVDREIALTRKSFNPSHGTINKEELVVFELEVGR